MRAAIIANGGLRPTRLLRQLLRHADLVVCADGGLRAARALGVAPQVAIGDFDSAGTALRAWARRRGTRLVPYPREKDQTDTELAIEYALRAGADDIDLLGALGGRVDHALANIGLLIHVAARGRRARLVHEQTELFLANTQSSIPGRVGDLVSLIPLSPTVAGVTTRGLKYPLTAGRLRLSSTRGISNEITALPARVRLRRGWLLVVVTHRASSRRR
jgi:thiamine pyrophosphokinase